MYKGAWRHLPHPNFVKGSGEKYVPLKIIIVCVAHLEARTRGELGCCKVTAAVGQNKKTWQEW